MIRTVSPMTVCCALWLASLSPLPAHEPSAVEATTRLSAAASPIIWLSSITGSDGYSRIGAFPVDAEQRLEAISNIDFTKLPQVMHFGQWTFFNLHGLVDMPVASADIRAAISQGTMQFATWQAAEADNLAETNFFNALERLHTEVEQNKIELEKQAVEQREAARKAAVEKARQQAELERKFQLYGRVPSTLGVRLISVQGGKPVDQSKVVPLRPRPAK